ncbi:hypothetical protein D3C81_1320310 [compost metagenome]
MYVVTINVVSVFSFISVLFLSVLGLAFFLDGTGEGLFFALRHSSALSVVGMANQIAFSTGQLTDDP